MIKLCVFLFLLVSLSQSQTPPDVTQQFENSFTCRFLLGSFTGYGWIDYDHLGGKTDFTYFGTNFTVVVHPFPPEKGGITMYMLSNGASCTKLGNNQHFPKWEIPKTATYMGKRTIGQYSNVDGWKFPNPDTSFHGMVEAWVLGPSFPTHPVIELIVDNVSIFGDVTITSWNVTVKDIDPQIYDVPSVCPTATSPVGVLTEEQKVIAELMRVMFRLRT